MFAAPSQAGKYSRSSRRAQWLLRFRKKKAALRKFGAALRALGVTLNFEYHRLDGLTQLFSDLLLFALGQSRRQTKVRRLRFICGLRLSLTSIISDSICVVACALVPASHKTSALSAAMGISLPPNTTELIFLV